MKKWLINLHDAECVIKSVFMTDDEWFLIMLLFARQVSIQDNGDSLP